MVSRSSGVVEEGWRVPDVLPLGWGIRVGLIRAVSLKAKLLRRGRASKAVAVEKDTEIATVKTYIKDVVETVAYEVQMEAEEMLLSFWMDVAEGMMNEEAGVLLSDCFERLDEEGLTKRIFQEEVEGVKEVDVGIMMG